jgi:hypothetical protein
MIIWSGFGFLVVVIVFAFSLALNFAFNAWWGPSYYDTHKWPVAISLFLSAIVCWFLGTALRKRKSRVVVDKATGKEFTLSRSNHRLFFIPMHLWGPILAVIGVVLLVMDFLK